MIRGTTPVHKFELPFDTADISTVRVIYAQGNSVLLEKSTEECRLDKQSIRVRLTQEETMLFDHRYKAQIQVRVLTKTGSALTSDVITVDVGKLLKDEVLVDDVQR